MFQSRLYLTELWQNVLHSMLCFVTILWHDAEHVYTLVFESCWWIYIAASICFRIQYVNLPDFEFSSTIAFVPHDQISLFCGLYSNSNLQSVLIYVTVPLFLDCVIMHIPVWLRFFIHSTLHVLKFTSRHWYLVLMFTVVYRCLPLQHFWMTMACVGIICACFKPTKTRYPHIMRIQYFLAAYLIGLCRILKPVANSIWATPSASTPAHACAIREIFLEDKFKTLLRVQWRCPPPLICSDFYAAALQPLFSGSTSLHLKASIPNLSIHR
jgi:hypothetical protein